MSFFLIAVCLALTTCQAPANEGRKRMTMLLRSFTDSPAILNSLGNRWSGVVIRGSACQMPTN